MKYSIIISVTLSAALFLLAGLTFGKTSPGENLQVDIDEKKLRSGELQVFNLDESVDVSGVGKRKRILGVMLFNASAEDVWSILKQWERTPEFVPAVNYYKILKVKKPVRKDAVGKSLIEGSMRVAFMNIIYTLNVEFYEDRMRHEWRMLSDDEIKEYREQGVPVQDNSSTLRIVEGFGFVKPYGDGSQSVYYYSPVVETGVPVPGYIERSLTERSLNDYMGGLKKLVEE